MTALRRPLFVLGVLLLCSSYPAAQSGSFMDDPLVVNVTAVCRR